MINLKIRPFCSFWTLHTHICQICPFLFLFVIFLPICGLYTPLYAKSVLFCHFLSFIVHSVLCELYTPLYAKSVLFLSLFVLYQSVLFGLYSPLYDKSVFFGPFYYIFLSCVLILSFWTLHTLIYQYRPFWSFFVHSCPLQYILSFLNFTHPS